MGYTTFDISRLFEESLNSPEVADAIPQAWSDRLYGLFTELKSNLEELCFRVQVRTPASTFNLPVVKLTSNPFQSVSEGGTPSEATPVFEKVQVSIEKRSALFEWTYECREDVPKMVSAIEQLIKNWLIADWDQRIVSLLDSATLNEVSGALTEDLILQAIGTLEDNGRETANAVLAVSPTEARTVRGFEHFIPKTLYKASLGTETRYEIGRLWDISVTVTKALASGKAYLIISNSILHAIKRPLTIEERKRITTETEVYKASVRDGFAIIDPEAVARILIT
ncbi:MAG: hypothetical protein DRJ41_03435 [Thermoprotei archaeon]|nr:MAG: hypothetical protein DRJ41_03435 [Thermoprotei archaeon]